VPSFVDLLHLILNFFGKEHESDYRSFYLDCLILTGFFHWTNSTSIYFEWNNGADFLLSGLDSQPRERDFLKLTNYCSGDHWW
jgi:hypothetical protein